MFSEIGDTRNCVSIDLADLAELRRELELFKKSKLYQLFKVDLDIYERQLMQGVKTVLPESMYQEKVREQAIGEALMADKMIDWFETTEVTLDEYQKQKEQETTS